MTECPKCKSSKVASGHLAVAGHILRRPFIRSRRPEVVSIQSGRRGNSQARSFRMSRLRDCLDDGCVSREPARSSEAVYRISMSDTHEISAVTRLETAGQGR